MVRCFVLSYRFAFGSRAAFPLYIAFLFSLIGDLPPLLTQVSIGTPLPLGGGVDVVLDQGVVERPDPPTQVVLGAVDGVLLVIVLEVDFGLPAGEAAGVGCGLRVVDDGAEGYCLHDLVDGETAAIGPAYANRYDGAIGIGTCEYVHVLLMHAAAGLGAAAAYGLVGGDVGGH